MAARLAKRLHIARPIRLLESSMVDVPTVIGWLRPVVLMPASALAGMAPQQLEAILAHELAHIRRHDYLVNLLQTLVETLLFYHPAVWWLSRRIRVERENCCDDLAVSLCGDPYAYARALADLEELRADSSRLVLAATGGSLLHRVRRLIGTPIACRPGPGMARGRHCGRAHRGDRRWSRWERTRSVRTRPRRRRPCCRLSRRPTRQRQCRPPGRLRPSWRLRRFGAVR